MYRVRDLKSHEKENSSHLGYTYKITMRILTWIFTKIMNTDHMFADFFTIDVRKIITSLLWAKYFVVRVDSDPVNFSFV